MTRVRRLVCLAALGVISLGLSAPAPVAARAVAARAPRAAARETPYTAMSAEQRAFVDTLQHRTFNFFWETTHPENGLAPDRWPSLTFASVAAMGFSLASVPVGIEHRWIPRTQGRERVLNTLRFLWRAKQDSAETGVTGYRGFFYHFLKLDDGTRFEHLELSSIDTELLMAGALFCGQYFDRKTPEELEIRTLADSLYRRVDWRWMQPRAPLMCLGWTPAKGHLPYDTGHYNETMLLMILALGSPTHPADPGTWERYTRGYRWGTFHGQEYLGFAPMFGHQSSHLFVDFRGIRDAFMRKHGLDYFENSRRATLAQRQYATDNPGGWDDYGPRNWGLSACDGGIDGDFVVEGKKRHFQTYWARGASHTEVLDDGTLTPNAAGGSIAFCPDEVVPTLMAMKEHYGDRLWGRYGYFDAFNPTLKIEGHEKDGIDPKRGWVDHDYLGIDQGLIVLMIENWRSGLLWDRMRKSPYLARGLRAAGFTGGWLDRAPRSAAATRH